MTDHEDPVVDGALADARKREPGPPPGFAASVMRSVSEAQASFSWSERRARRAAAANFSKTHGVNPTDLRQAWGGGAAHRGAVAMKKILLGTAAIGAVVIVAAWYMGFPPSSDGTEATVGAANRYQGGQMASKDVKLGNTDIQNFIQSDVFAKLVNDPKARETLKRIGSDEAYRELVLNNSWLEIMRNPEAEAAFGAGASALFAEPAFTDAMANSVFAEAAKNPTFLGLLSSEAFGEAMRKAGGGQQDYFKVVAKYPELEAAMNDKTMRAPFQDEAAYRLLRNPAFLDMLRNPEVGRLLRNPEVGRLLRNPAFIEAARNPEVGRLLRNPAFGEALRNPATAETLRKPGFVEIMRNPAYVEVMRNPAFVTAFDAEAARKK